ncbi:uracil-DNA glycosylase family protein [Aquisphaera insulae]|uniref:uracil-DNA glycosylase family protein n=1 Tax=Aquisphaera insulae TaxID=2712864 RepID=UPI0013EBC8EB|nr:uracil-DNA glycosylase family protein [Aquisphaera insulae]
MTRGLTGLLEDIRTEADRADFPVDREVYEKHGKDPAVPILFAGSLGAPACVFGRDLGKDEVKHGQPLVGAGGKLVREGVLRAFAPARAGTRPSREDLEAALEFVLLTNTVPYKPPGNKAYADSVKERFRPFVARLLIEFWGGSSIITLGTEAFAWFARYATGPEFETLGKTDERYEAAFPCRLVATTGDAASVLQKDVVVLPLPHPSPLNRRWIAQFPNLLDRRLNQVRES